MGVSEQTTFLRMVDAIAEFLDDCQQLLYNVWRVVTAEGALRLFIRPLILTFASSLRQICNPVGSWVELHEEVRFLHCTLCQCCVCRVILKRHDGRICHNLRHHLEEGVLLRLVVSESSRFIGLPGAGFPVFNR